MGRKPNTLIGEYFTRGAKLDDSSNRYQHTCRTCGEVFPKGRTDSLIKHLISKCTALSLDERRRVILRAHNLGTPPHGGQQTSPSSASDALNTSLPFSPSRQFDRLNVLAEASRQVGGTKSLPGYTSATIEKDVVDPALELEDFLTGASVSNLNDSVETTISAPSAGLYVNYLQQYSQSQSTDLPTIAASANSLAHDAEEVPTLSTEHAAQTLEAYPHGSSEDTFFASNAVRWNDTAKPPAKARKKVGRVAKKPKVPEVPKEAEVRKDDSTFFPIQRSLPPLAPSAPHMSDQELITSPFDPSAAANTSQKSKARGKFSTERRKQVQQLRRLGACIRCRILKKPCSGDDPCHTCRSIEGPRLWKEPCTRARLADEFTLYAAGPHSVLAYQKVSNAKERAQFSSEAVTKIQVFHFDDLDGRLQLNAIRGTVLAKDCQPPAPQLLLIAGEAENLPAKVEQDIQNASSRVVAREQSTVMRATLEMAQRLAETDSSGLLSKSVDLWVATQLLVDKSLPWNITAHLSVGPTPSEVTISDSNSPLSYTLLSHQLQGAVEKRASYLCKSIMTELEQRVIQRYKSDKFETFLVAFVLLNCIERITWLFKTQESNSEVADWPLERPAAEYGEQGERFSGILHMLLRVRGLPPKAVHRSSDDVLVPVEKTDENANNWYGDIRVTKSFLERCEADVFDASDLRSLDGKFFSNVFRS